VPLTKLAAYKSIIWSSSSNVATRMASELPVLWTFIVHRNTKSGGATISGKATPNLMALTMAAGGHILIAGSHPVQNVVPRTSSSPRFPLIFLYELEDPQTGTPDVQNPSGLADFAYRELCLETLDFSPTNTQRLRRVGNTGYYCAVGVNLRNFTTSTQQQDGMRSAEPIDPNFPRLTLRPECSNVGKAYAESRAGLDVEIYNPLYFALFCQYVPLPRACFQPIYGLGCLDTADTVYGQPVAFYTSAYADRVAEVAGAVGARSVVFGFPPVYFKPAEVRPAIEEIMFNEWKLPRKATSTASN
jgi:hypothetical protein